ncbi:c-type cytochrome [Methyloglobulus sp.]|uniref:c-type cytochrome n=1 Tax=Methyloglobulus sp. TaxID=2518622 RepID=UPI00398A1949
MKKNWLALSLTLALALALSGTVPILHAEETVAEGNSAAGKGNVSSCGGCHGENGNSAMPTFPKLAQQHSSYLVKQLQAFKGGTRNDPVMSPMALALNDADMLDIAAYYSSQNISANPAPVLPADEDTADGATDEKKAKEAMQALLAKGSNLYRNGNLASEVSACIACHGPSGEGNKPAAFPALRSQHADYLIKSLTDFKSGTRSNNPENMMHMIAKKMSDEEIKAVSYHISTMK